MTPSSHLVPTALRNEKVMHEFNFRPTIHNHDYGRSQMSNFGRNIVKTQHNLSVQEMSPPRLENS